MRFIFLAMLFLLVSCATPYQKSGWSGGYTDTQLAGDMYEVHFSGNGYTGSQTVHNYLLRRCAEITQERGYTHFLPVSSNKDIDTSYSSTYNNYSQSVNTYETTKHSNTMIIKLLNNPDNKLFAYDAKMIFPIQRTPANSQE